jgi:hypothetical protein
MSLAEAFLSSRAKRAVVSFRTLANAGVAACAQAFHNFCMKIFVSVLVAVGLSFAVYVLYLKKMPTAAEGTASTQAISISGVRMDLLQIAKAERTSISVDGHCMSMDELLASGSMSMSRPERDGYTYSVECSGSDFTATAHHAAAASDSPIRYPILAIDQSMQVREVQ